MTQIIAISTVDGGAGKTTTTLNLGAALAELGQRVLLVDLDPQSILTRIAGIRATALRDTVYTAIKDYMENYEPSLDKAIHTTLIGVDVAATNQKLNLALEELITAPRREYIVQQLLKPLLSRYDTILIDTMPYWGTLTINALVAADSVIIPMPPEETAMESAKLTLTQIKALRRSGLNPELNVLGILLTLVDMRANFTRQAIAEATRLFQEQAPVLPMMIKATVRVKEAQANRQSMLQYQSNHEVSQAFRELARLVSQSEVADVPA